MGPTLYLLHTAEIPNTGNTLMATFADDTAILASHVDPVVASKYLQETLNKISDWLSKWRIKANQTKSVQITFTNRKGDCPPVKLNNKNLPQENRVPRYVSG